ncbi:transcriptional repressor ILP1 isoform X1 [Selaginella moellendorffii]|nr:transcriptional repressor ILP1 isoform X1 [Selaginella moellendorffii]|eukprot:XP_024520759.1 transcriptional repressor ILP1 isoform X1 [Selaginella moellendorffii]
MSKNKNFRKRGDGEAGDDDPVDQKLLKEKIPASKPGRKQLLSFAEEAAEEADDPSPGIAATAGKRNAVRGKPPRKPASSSTLLSFDGEDGNSSRGRKRSGYGPSHGSGHAMGAGKDKAQAVSNVLPQAGEYTPERLQELQKNTIRLGGAKPVLPVESKPPPAEPLVILKGVLKPVLHEGGESSVLVNSSNELPVVPPEDGVDAVMEAAFGGVDGLIPDAAAIAAAKAQRERKRIAHSAPDYIPVGSSSDADFRSRIRDAPEVVLKKDEAVSSDDEAEEVRGRLTFIGHKDNGKKAGVFDFVENVEEEDEEKMWEEEQLKKGVGKRVEDPSSRGVPLLPGGAYGQVPSRPLVAHPTFTLDQQAESAMLALQQGLKRLQESHAKTQSDLYSVEQNLTSSAASITMLEEKFSSAGKKYIYMQQLRDFVSTLCAFLQAKSPLIEELEEHMQKLHEERADAVFQRRILDGADEKVQLDSAIEAAMAVLTRGGSIQTASAHASSATQAAAAAALNGIAPELDEFGRDTSLQKRMEMKSRASARKRRISRVLAKTSSEECSSDESDNEMAFGSGRDETLETAERIFSDASEEYSQLEMVKNRLTEWHREYPAAYTDAYVSLSAPAIFAPFVRLELLKWDPLRDSAGFESMKWHSLLCEYDDSDLVPSLVERVALPLLHHYIGHCWDRLSTTQTRNAVAAVQEISVYVPATSDAFIDLVALVRSRIAAAVSEVEVPTWSAQLTTAVEQAAEIAEYRFRLSIKLLRNIGLWKNVLSLSKLNQLGLEELLNGRILPHLRVLAPEDAVARTETVLVALHGTWISSGVKDMCPELGAFIQHVISLGRTLEKLKKRDVAALAQAVRKMLLSLNQPEKARELARVFQLKEPAVS